MKAIVRICNQNGEKSTGFGLSKQENLSKLINYDFGIGTKFRIGVRELEITTITIDGFYKETKRPTLDDPHATMNCNIWLYCKCDDENFLTDGADYTRLLEEIASTEIDSASQNIDGEKSLFRK